MMMQAEITITTEDAKSKVEDDGLSRRGALKCMVWAGTGILWTLSGGVPKSLGLLGDALAAVPSGFTFLQISDSHIGFNKPANPDALGTLREAIGKVQAVNSRPAFMIHTGDITHLSKPDEFDNAEQIIGEAKLHVHYVPGEHDFVDEGVGKAYLERYGKGTKGQGWYSFDDHGVHFIGLVNVVDLKAGGLGRLGADQFAWLADDLKDKSASTPIVVFAHIPLWTVYADWGWGTDDGLQALNLLKRFGSVTVLNGHIHQIVQKVAPSPGPMTVPAEKLRSVLGITSVDVRIGDKPLAITDTTLAE
jgi:hypothetical protein